MEQSIPHFDLDVLKQAMMQCSSLFVRSVEYLDTQVRDAAENARVRSAVPIWGDGAYPELQRRRHEEVTNALEKISYGMTRVEQHISNGRVGLNTGNATSSRSDGSNGHRSCICNVCIKRNVDKYVSCLQCSDYTMCFDCFKDFHKHGHHPAHEFGVIGCSTEHVPSDVEVLLKPGRGKNLGATCDHCQTVSVILFNSVLINVGHIWSSV